MISQNPDKKIPAGNPLIFSPRISFSTDLINPKPKIKAEATSYRDEPVSSSDFEFSAVAMNKHHSMIMSSADELFSKGEILPYRARSVAVADQNIHEELEDHTTGSEGFVTKPTKIPTRFKGFFGFGKQSHIGSKKFAENEGPGF